MELHIVVMPCWLNPIPQTCVPINEVKRQELYIIIPRVQFDPEDKNSPITFIGSIDQNIVLDPDNQLTKTMNFKNVEVFDDRWDFFKESLRISYAEVDQVKDQYIGRTQANLMCTNAPPQFCEPYLHVIVRSGGKFINIKRVYGKIFNLLGELGGFMDILLVLFALSYIIIRCQNDGTKIKKRILGKNFVKHRSLLSEESNSALKQRNKNNPKDKDKELIEIEDEILDEASDGINLSQKALEVDVINNLIFKDYHRALLPFVYRHQAKMRLEQNRVNKVASVMIKQTIDKNQALKNIFGKQKATLVDREMKPDIAYGLLCDSSPLDELEVKMKEFFMANIPQELKNTQENKIPNLPNEKPQQIEKLFNDAFSFLGNKDLSDIKIVGEVNEDNIKLGRDEQKDVN